MNNSALTNEELKQILDRIIGFISNCDNKVSYLLSFLGVISTILFTVKSPNMVFIKSSISQNPINPIFFFGILGFIISIIFFIKGLYHLTQALVAKTNCDEYERSVMFFGHIANKYNDYEEYLKLINSTNDISYRKDLASQIYINSTICSKKFANYNSGFMYSVYSLPILIVTWLYLFQS